MNSPSLSTLKRGNNSFDNLVNDKQNWLQNYPAFSHFQNSIDETPFLFPRFHLISLMYRTVRAATRTCNSIAALPTVNRRGFALVLVFVRRFLIFRNDISVRKRLTIGLSGFAVVATGCFFGGRAIYRNRKAKKIARAAAKKEEPIVTEPVMPVIPPTPEPSHPEAAVAAVEAEAAPEKVEEAAPVEKEEAAPAEEKEEPAEKKEEAPASVEEEEYHPWWEGVKEISVFLPADEIEKLDAKFPATRQYKSGLTH